MMFKSNHRDVGSLRRVDQPMRPRYSGIQKTTLHRSLSEESASWKELFNRAARYRKKAAI
jgi:hypothetical protein